MCNMPDGRRDASVTDHSRAARLLGRNYPGRLIESRWAPGAGLPREASMTLLGIEREAFSAIHANGGAPTPASIPHELRSHPLLTLDALGDLADSLPSEDVEHHLNDLPTVLSDGRTPQLEGLSPGELVREVATNRCWVVLWNIEQSRTYAELLDQCLAEVTPSASPGEPVVMREGFVFISAPDTVTPVHIDPEHNVLLQVSGEKTITVGRFGDVGERDRKIEQVLMGGHRWLANPACEEQSFPMTPGSGTYVPPFAPHRVQNGDDFCVSLSVTWRTGAYYRREHIHKTNARLRRLGISPRSPGDSALRDLVKVGVSRAGRPVKTAALKVSATGQTVTRQRPQPR